MNLTELSEKQQNIYCNVLLDVINSVEFDPVFNSFVEPFIECRYEDFFKALTASQEQREEALRRTLQILPSL